MVWTTQFRLLIIIIVSLLGGKIFPGGINLSFLCVYVLCKTFRTFLEQRQVPTMSQSNPDYSLTFYPLQKFENDFWPVGVVLGGSEDELDAGRGRGEAQRWQEDDHKEKIPKSLLHYRVVLTWSETEITNIHHLKFF